MRIKVDPITLPLFFSRCRPHLFRGLPICVSLVSILAVADQPGPSAPELVAQPESQIRQTGENVSFETMAWATPPPSFQWLWEGQPIIDQTNGFLALTNLQVIQSGTYSVVVSNEAGVVTSRPAHLFVSPPPMTAGSVDPTFDPGAGLDSTSVYRVRAIQFQEGKIIVAGKFSSYDGISVGNIARLNSDGSLDTTFKTSGSNGEVEVLLVDADHRIYVGGSFSKFNNLPSSALVRLNPDGTLDESFTSPAFQTVGVPYSVTSLFLEAGGRLLVAGCLDSQTCVRSVVRLNPDGSPDSNWNAPELNMLVADMAVQNDGRIIVGGRDSGSATQGTVLRLLRDGTRDPSFTAFTVPQWIRRLLLLEDGRIIVGLWQSTRIPSLGQRASYLALTQNGELDDGFAATNSARLMDGVTALLRRGSGSFLVAGSESFLGRVDASGAVDSVYRPKPDRMILAMALQLDGNLLIGGQFSRVNQVARRGIARIQEAEQAAAPMIFGALMTGDGFHLTIPTGTNHQFQLEFKASLDQPSWQPVATIKGDGGWMNLKDPEPPGMSRFYRIRVD